MSPSDPLPPRRFPLAPALALLLLGLGCAAVYHRMTATVAIGGIGGHLEQYRDRQVRISGAIVTTTASQPLRLADCYLLQDDTGRIVVHTSRGLPKDPDPDRTIPVVGQVRDLTPLLAAVAKQFGLPDVFIEETRRGR